MKQEINRQTGSLWSYTCWNRHIQIQPVTRLPLYCTTINRYESFFVLGPWKALQTPAPWIAPSKLLTLKVYTKTFSIRRWQHLAIFSSQMSQIAGMGWNLGECFDRQTFKGSEVELESWWLYAHSSGLYLAAPSKGRLLTWNIPSLDFSKGSQRRYWLIKGCHWKLKDWAKGFPQEAQETLVL